MDKYKCHHIGCNEMFNNRMSRKRHMSKCQLPKPDEQISAKENFDYDSVNDVCICKICSTVVKHRNNTSRHANECKLNPAVKSTPKEFPCLSPMCGKVFQYRSKLKQHSVVHREQLICIYCNKVFKSEVPFNKHVETCPKFLC